MNFDTDQKILLRQSNNPEEASTWILVLSAAGLQHTVEAELNSFLLYIPSNLQHKADYELISYVDENRNWPPPKPAPDTFTPQFLPFSILLMGILAIFYLITGPWDAHSNWFETGAGNSELILHQFHWFRLITPLTLHADIVHLTGNCIIGGILLHFLCKSTGNGLAFFFTLLSGFLGNLVNVMLHGSGHVFVGFSTAVFGIIGMQTALQAHSYFKNKQSPLRVFTPFMAGLALLALFGSSGERTDLGAHFFGLLCGGLVGLLCNKLILKFRGHLYIQFTGLLFSILLLLVAWFSALSSL